MRRDSGAVLATLGAVALAAGFVLSTVFMHAQSQAPQAAPATQTAGQHFKNIQVLKDIPADQLDPTMDFIANSLGVRCEYCHVRSDFSKDDKRPKLTARKMIAMELAINKANFNGRTEVTCYTCHRGLTHPVGAPVIAALGAAAPAAAEMMPGGGNSASMPTADQILEKYVAAIGGADAANKITSRQAKGTLAGGRGAPIPLELFAKAPGKLLIVLHRPNGGANEMAYNDGQSWGSDGQHTRPLRGGMLDVVQSQAKLAFAGNLKESLGRLRMGRPEKLGDQQAYVLNALAPGQPPTKLYFDEQSGLLMRVESFNRTPLGMDPVAVDYSDYRDSGGVKVPYRWTIGGPGNRSTIQFSDIEQNAAVDNSKFAPPAGPAAPSGGSQ